MKIGINQPYLFPYIGYFQLIHAVDAFMVLDDVQYIKGGWINGNRTLCSGRERIISLPVKRDSQMLNINERYFAEPFELGKREFLQKVRNDYCKAPHFRTTFSLLETIFSYNETNVAVFVTRQLKMVCEYLGICTPFQISSATLKNSGLKGQERVIEMNKALGTKHYINSIGGVGMYDKEAFLREGMQLSFLRPAEIRYRQFNNDFMPNLSIIDVMMFNSKEEIGVMLKKFELV